MKNDVVVSGDVDHGDGVGDSDAFVKDDVVVSCAVLVEGDVDHRDGVGDSDASVKDDVNHGSDEGDSDAVVEGDVVYVYEAYVDVVVDGDTLAEGEVWDGDVAVDDDYGDYNVDSSAVEEGYLVVAVDNDNVFDVGAVVVTC